MIKKENIAQRQLVNKLSRVSNLKLWRILIMGFASGLPLGLTGSTLQAWYSLQGVDVITIGFLALVGQPYVYKFVWAPVLDRVDFPQFGRRRGWMLTTQLGLITTLIAMAMCDPATMPVKLGILAIILAFVSSTQDIAIDAFRAEILEDHEKGIGAAMAVAGYRAAMLVSAGFALMLAHFVGFKVTYLVMAGLVGLVMVNTLCADEPKMYGSPPKDFRTAFAKPFSEFFSRDNAILVLLFIVLYKMGDAFAGTLTTHFLLSGVGFSMLDVGLINKTVGLATTLLGAFIGGWLMIKMGMLRSLFYFGLLQAVTNLLFMMLAKMGPNYTFMVITICAENIAGGMGTAAFIAFLMAQCDPRFTATQYALLSALSAVGRVFVGPAAGILVAKLGWVIFFGLTVVFALPGLLILLLLAAREDMKWKTIPAGVQG